MWVLSIEFFKNKRGPLLPPPACTVYRSSPWQVSMCGTLFGAAVPFFICCSTMLSARKAASLVVTETRSQYLCPASAQYLKKHGLTFHPAILVKDDRNLGR